MNFLDIYNHYVSVERVIEVEPEPPPIILRDHAKDIVIKEPKISPSTAASEKSPWIIDGPINREKPSLYLHLNLLDGHISYQGKQNSTVRMGEDGLLEGTYSADRRLTFSRVAFTAVVIKTFELWKSAYTFYMVHGNSPKFNRFRDIVVIREDRLAPVTIKLNDNFHEYYAQKFSIKKDPARITIPLVSFSRSALDFLIDEPVLTIPESSGEDEFEIQDLIDGILLRFPKEYL